MGRVIPRDSLIGMVGAPIAWAVHFLVIYIFTAVACAFGFSDVRFLGVGIVNSSMLIFTALTLALIAWLGWLAHRRWRRAGGPEEPGDPVSARHQFMGLTALLLCILSGVAVAYEGIPLVVMSGCG
ncbi:MAG TPA: hypothetical protein VK943_04205 [Arenibaculum sp.]|nr:hypothetical protein [Arenibaculum sp.]